MLLYNKALDPYHTLLRFIVVLTSIGNKTIEDERLRIFDFIMANPSHIEKMSLGQELLQEKNIFKKYRSVYNHFDPIMLFESMRPIQQAVVSSLLEMTVLTNLEGTTRYQINLANVSEGLAEIAQDDQNSIPRDVVAFINGHLVDFDLLGEKGLKGASKLMEFRYDFV